MNQNNNCAELVDRMNQRLAIGFLVVSLAYAFDVVSFLVSESAEVYTNLAGNVFAILSVVVILLALWPIFNKQITKAQAKAHEAESFITEALHNSIRISWMVTLVFLTFLMAMDTLRGRLDLPTDFYFKLLFFIMMFTVGLSFMIRTRDNEPMELS